MHTGTMTSVTSTERPHPGGGGFARLRTAVRALWHAGRRARCAVSRRYDACVDRWMGLRTQVRDGEGAAPAAHADAVRYEPCDYIGFRRALRQIGVRPGRDVFLDLGSGKGRAVIMAARWPFRRVIGVELSTDLHAQAAANVRDAGARLACRDVTLVCSDAAAYEIPADCTTVFLFNPFVGETLRRVMDNLRRSLELSPRRMTIVYKNTELASAVLASQSWLRPGGRVRASRGPDYEIYEAGRDSDPSAGEPSPRGPRRPGAPL